MNPEGIRSAAYARLIAGGLAPLLSQAYGRPAIFWEKAPQSADSGSAPMFPYVTVSMPANVGFNDKSDSGDNAIVQVDIWSRTADGALERIAKAAFAALHRAPWSIPGFITAECEGMDFMADPDGVTRRCMIRLRVLTLPPV